ncbi:MAG TPA: type I methionyl aminopeptidase [Bryobacteraceae bacterium]|jgi:methionyl aminopeptidase|nr:type I methionyl aminopeptidase [Bryobacteraceae bacterium]
MSIKSDKDFVHMKTIGRIVRQALDRMSASVRPGVTTAELNAIGSRVLLAEGARSAPPLVYGYPADVCISVNDEAIHGIPGPRILREGDLVKLDLVAEKNGYYADSAVTVIVGAATPEATALIRGAESAFREGARAARAGARVYEIGRAVEREVRKRGFTVLRELCGHGVGRTIHEEPSVPNYHDPRSRARLTDGLVITIEPIISAGNGTCSLQDDRWTIATGDRSLAAHYEHTIVVTRGAPILLTAAA